MLSSCILADRQLGREIKVGGGNRDVIPRGCLLTCLNLFLLFVVLGREKSSGMLWFVLGWSCVCVCQANGSDTKYIGTYNAGSIALISLTPYIHHS